VFPWLLSWARRQVSPRLRRREGASDIVQDALQTADAGFSGFRGTDERTFKSWLKRIFRNTLGKAIRSNTQQRRDMEIEVSLQTGSNSDSWLGADPGSFRVARVSDAGDGELLEQAIDLLDEVERRRLRMFYFDDLSYAEIARLENVETETALRSQLMRARKKLRMIISVLKRIDEQRYVPLQRQSIQLWYFRGKSQGEIAVQLNLPEKCVACWIADAKSSGLFDEGDES